jgi:TrwC relaxase
LGFLEERAAVARVQSQGVRRRVATEGWVVAGFAHRTSREGDPQLHTHCLVPNLERRTGDGRHVAFDAGPLFEWVRAAGSVYQNQLQHSVSLRVRDVLGSGPSQLKRDCRLHGPSCERFPSAPPKCPFVPVSGVSAPSAW